MEVPNKLWGGWGGGGGGGRKKKKKKKKGGDILFSWLLRVISKSWYFFHENINKLLSVISGLMEKVQNPEAITLRCSYKRRGEPSNSLLRARALIRKGYFFWNI